MAFGEKVLINLRFNIDPLNAGIMLEFVHLYFIVEVTYVTDDSIVFHLAHVVYGDDIAIAGGSNVNIAFVEAFFDGFYLETFHGGLQGANGIDFRHNYS
jgi:hypothetical protein